MKLTFKIFKNANPCFADQACMSVGILLLTNN